MHTLKKHLNANLIIGILAALCVVLGVLSWQQSVRAEEANTQLNSLRYKSFYETLDLMDNLQLNLEKLNITSSRTQEQALLSDIARQADNAQENLSSLPISQQNLSDTLKFVNQLSDYSQVLGEGISSGRPLSQDDQLNLLNLAQRCQKLGDALREIEPQLLSGELSFQELGAEPVAAGQDDEESVDYPTLIYDGPFSDGQDNRSFRGLSGEAINAEQAAQIAQELLADRQVSQVSQVEEMDVPVENYDLDVTTQQGSFSISLTQTGGKLLYMLPNFSVEGENLSIEQCIEAGQRFLSEHGFGEMQASYYKKLEGILTVNYAAVQQGVLLYPDLVKVQISMADGSIIGIEAANYWRNHVTRTSLIPSLSMDQAQEYISDRLDVTASRLCIIPLNSGEALCYEFEVALDDARYLMYIDANDGRERRLLKRISEPDGELVMG